MKPIIYNYNVSLIKQGLQECLQASAAELLNYYGVDKPLNQIKKEIPVYVSEKGKSLGTSIGHIATYFIQEGFKTVLHIVDVEIFDRSWKLNANSLIDNLEKREKFIKHYKYDEKAFRVIFDGYLRFLRAGGEIIFPVIDEKYLLNLLHNGPFIAIVSYNFLNSSSKYKFTAKENKPQADSIKGSPGTHAVVVAGYKLGKFLVIDSDTKYGGKRWVEASRLVGAIYLAETDYDCMLITVSR